MPFCLYILTLRGKQLKITEQDVRNHVLVKYEKYMYLFISFYFYICNGAVLESTEFYASLRCKQSGRSQAPSEIRVEFTTIGLELLCDRYMFRYRPMSWYFTLLTDESF
jgi:hypothetical protein